MLLQQASSEESRSRATRAGQVLTVVIVLALLYDEASVYNRIPSASAKVVHMQAVRRSALIVQVRGNRSSCTLAELALFLIGGR